MRRVLSPDEMADRIGGAGRGALNDVLGNTQLDVAVREARAQIAAGDKAEPATARVLIGLHAVFHETAYGSMPEEMRGRAYFAALNCCRSLLAAEFGEDVEAAVSYVAWAWQREISRERKRREEQREDAGRRLGWNLVFGKPRMVLGDWKAAMARRRGAVK